MRLIRLRRLRRRSRGERRTNNGKTWKKNPSPLAIAKVSYPESCQECANAHKRVHCTLDLGEAQQVVDALGGDSPLGEYFNALIIVTQRRDNYEC